MRLTNVGSEITTPTVLLIVDRSGSMDEDFEGQGSRWDVLRDFLLQQPGGLIYDLQSQVRFGLAMYTAESNRGELPIGECPMLEIIVPDLNNYDEIAPVYAVRGNRDWIALRQLPKKLLLNFSGVEIGLVHGHGGLRHYLLKRIEYLFRGYRLEMFLPNVRAAFPQARVIVFGHTHRPLQLWVDGQFIFNPGSPHCPEGKNTPPSVGLLHINSGGQVESELVWLA